MLTFRVSRTSSLLEKTKGIIGKKYFLPTLIETRWGIHTFFVSSAIDIVILDDETIVGIKVNMKPFSVFFWNPRYNKILECPAGTIKKYDLHPGKKIKLLF